jgi:uncharacterized membrane protein YhaH (DUF805 family)
MVKKLLGRLLTEQRGAVSLGGLSTERLLGLVIAVVGVVVALLMLQVVITPINDILERSTLDLYHSGTAALIRLLPLIIVVGIMGMSGYIGFTSIRGSGASGTGSILGIVLAYVFLIVGLVVFPIALDTIVTLNQPSSGLSDFSGTLPLLNLIPLLYTVSLMGIAGFIIWGSLRSGGGRNKLM